MKKAKARQARRGEVLEEVVELRQRGIIWQAESTCHNGNDDGHNGHYYCLLQFESPHVSGALAGLWERLATVKSTAKQDWEMEAAKVNQTINQSIINQSIHQSIN